MKKIMLYVVLFISTYALCGCSDMTYTDGNNQTEQTKRLSETVDGFRYQIVTDYGGKTCRIVNISILDGSKCQQLNIPSEIKGYVVTRIGAELAEMDDSAETLKNVFGAYCEIDAEGWGIQGDGKKAQNIRGIKIPDTVVELTRGCFAGLSGVESVLLSGQLKKIGNCAMIDMPNLKRLSIPATVEEGLEFLCDTKWVSFSVDDKNAKYKAENGLLLSRAGDFLYGVVTDDTSILIPAFVTAFSENALTTNSPCRITIDPDNAVYASDGQCVYKKSNGELVAVSSDDGKLILSSRIKSLRTPVNVSGIEIDKIVFSDSIQSVEGKTSNSDFDYWLGDKISSYATWYMNGKKAPVRLSPIDMGIGTLVVPEQYSVSYENWIDKYKNWRNIPLKKRRD